MRKILSCAFKISVILSLAVFLLGFNLAQAADTALPPGLAKADPVQEGSVVEGVLKNGETDNFKIDLNAGYQLRAFGTATRNSGDESLLIINLVNRTGARLSTGQVSASRADVAEAFFYKGLTEANATTPETVYIEVKSEGPNPAASLNYKVSFEKVDRSDVFANTDAGDQLASALDLQLTKDDISFDKNFLGKNPCGSADQPKYCSTDEKDIYTVSLNAGRTLTSTVIPSAKLKLIVTLYDANANTVGTVSSVSEGAPAEVNYTATVNQQLYLEITSSAPAFFGSYAMSFKLMTSSPTISPAPAASTTPGGVSPAATPTLVSTPTGGSFNLWDYRVYFIIGGVVVVVLVVLLILLSVVKKRKARAAATEIEKLRHRIQTGAAAVAKPNFPVPPAAGTSRTMHSDLQRLTPRRPATSPLYRRNPSVSPRPSQGGPKPVFMPFRRTPDQVAAPAPSGLDKLIRQAPPPKDLPAAPMPPRGRPTMPPAVRPRPTPPSPPPLPPRPRPVAGQTVPGGRTPQPPAPGQVSGKAAQDIDDIFGAS